MRNWQALKQLRASLVPSKRLPVLFIGHGSPMNVLLDNAYTQQWSRVGKSLPPAQAIVVISAHWLTQQGTAITAAQRPALIYDFYGFPEELYQVQYPAFGDPAFAQRLKEAFIQYEAQLDLTRGLDHGTWTILKYLAPSAHTPVLQISLDLSQSFEQLLTMFAELRKLRDEGVLFIGSGNIVHNLYTIDPAATQPLDWAVEFDTKITPAIDDHNLQLLAHPDRLGSSAQLAIPTDDHYRPMLAAMALMYPNEQLDHFNTDFDFASVGMRSFITRSVL